MTLNIDRRFNRCEKVYGLLGLAAKKGSVVSGAEACERALKNGCGGLIILAGDAAVNTKKRYMRLINNKDIKCIVFGACAELGRRIGRGERSAVIVTDKGLARNICELLGYAAIMTGV